jgi:glycosyltransferase involved in cell wall biosynthesis
VSAALRVAFAFASRGIGGAERSMLRLMAHAHPEPFACSVIVVAPENPAFRKAVRALGVPYHGLSPLDASGFYSLLRSERPEVLYVFGRFRTVAWAALARRAGVECIVAAERSMANRWSDRLARKLDRHLVSAYVANSEVAGRNLRAILGTDRPPVSVVVNGIDRTALRTGDEGAPREPSVLCVGNITPNKGQGVLLEAVRLLRMRDPRIRATLVGRDFTRGRFFREAERKGLAESFTAAGFVDDIGAHLARASVVVLPTLHREGMPTSLLEAMAAGVPVVASRVGGVVEIVEDGATGLLVAPGDPRQLAGAIFRLLEDPSEALRLAGNARRYVQAHHDLSGMVDGHRRAFQEALSRAGVPRSPRSRGPSIEGPASVAHVTTAAISLRYLLLGQLLAIRDRGYAVTGVSSPGTDVAVLAARAIPHAAVTMTRRFTPLSDLGSLVGLYRLMRSGGFTIVHAHNPKPGLLAQVAARLAGVPVVVNTLHGFYFHDGMGPLGRRFYVALEKIAARCSDVILSQNEEDIETAVREGIAPRERLRYLGNGIDLGRFDPARLSPEARRRTRAGLGIAEHAPVVGFVGRLVAEKGVNDLLLAAREVLERIPGTRFLLVGGTDAEKPDRLTPEALERGLESALCLAGVRQDMPELYAAMDVFVLPSHREGFPRAPLEAAAMRVPCIATDIRGCRQAVSHGRTGLLVPVGEVSALAGAILTLLEDAGLAQRMGAEGRRRALREFDEQHVFKTVLAEYERLLHAKGLGTRIPAQSEPLSSAAGR